MPEIYDFDQNVPFLKLDEVEDGDIVTFDNEGRIVDDKWGSNRLQIDVILPNMEVRRITVNKTSRRNLTAKYGGQTLEWVNKCAVVQKKDIMLGGQFKKGLFLHPK